MEPRFIGWNVAAAHTFDFSFPDAWSRKKIKALPSRRPEVSAEMWNEVYSHTDDLLRLKWSGEVKVVMMEVAKESRGGSYITIEDLAPHGEESVEFLVNDELFYHAGDMTVPARPDSGIDSRQEPSGDDELMDQDDDNNDTDGKTGKPGETDLGALERDLLEYRFSEDDDGEVDGSLLLMTPLSFMSPTKEASADLSPIDPISQARECRSRDPQRFIHESPRRRKIEESMRVSFLSTLPEEEWERYQSELEGKTKRENRKSSHEPESGEVESQRSGDLFNERRSFRRERARRKCNADRGRKRESDTPYALGRSDHDCRKIKENSTNPGRL